jgi:raw score 6.63
MITFPLNHVSVGKFACRHKKKHLSLVFGDEDLDNETRDKNYIGKVYNQPLNKNKHYDRRQTRKDNASVGLRWSDSIKKLGIDTDIDLAIRSGSDIYLRFRAGKEWLITDRFSTRLEQIYRYGTNSKHYLRTNFENKYRDSANTLLANHLYLQSEHDIDEKNSWGNSFYRQHDFNNYKRLNYGIFIGVISIINNFILTNTAHLLLGVSRFCVSGFLFSLN